MNISDILFPILIVASIVWSLTKNLRKAKQEETAKTLLPGKKEVNVPPIKSPQLPVERKETEPFAGFHGQSSKKKKKEEKKATVHFDHSSQKTVKNYISPENSPLLENEDVASPFLDIHNMDELKKAVIYSEIFNRKEDC